MEQKIYYGETLVYSTSDRNTKFHNITLKRKAGCVPSLTFTVESGGAMPTPRSTVINAYIDNTKVFSGVATNITSGFYNENTVVCEGLAACLNEVVIQELKMRKTYTNKNETTVYLDGSYVSDDTLIICEERLYQQLNDLQAIINGQLDQDKHITLEVRNSANHPTWSTMKKRVKLDFERGSAMELISAIAEQSGCSLLFDNYTIAFVPEDYTLGASSQEIEYSENLLDLTNEVDYGTIASICVPYGAYWSDSDYAQAGLEGEDWHRINLKDLYGNSNYPNIIRLPVSLTGSTSYIYGVVNSSRQSAYGNVIVNKVFEDVTDFANLYNQAELYLNSLTGAQTIDINAIDTSGSGDIAPYKTITVNAVPQGIEVSNLRIVESDTHFGEPEKDTLTIGVSGQTLTNNVNTVTPEMAGQITNIVREKVIEQVRQNIPDEVVRGYYNGADQIMYRGFNYSTGEFSSPFSGRGDTVYLAYAPYYKNAGLDAYDLLEGGDSFQILLSGRNTYSMTVTEVLADGTTQELVIPALCPIRWTYDIELGEVSGGNIHYVLGITYDGGGNIGYVNIMPVNELTGEAIRFSSGDGRTYSYTKSGKVTIDGVSRVIQPVTESNVVMYNQGYESGSPYPLVQWTASHYTDTEIDVITTKTDSIYYYTTYERPFLVDTNLNPNAGYVNTASELYLYQQATGKWTLDKAKLDNYYTKYETSNLLAEKLDVTALASALSNYYTSEEVDNIVDALKNGLFVAVDTLPTASSDTLNKIYLVPKEDSENNDIKDEYITLEVSEGVYAWELIGSTQIDLSGYVKTIKVGETTYSVDENTTNITLPTYESGAEVNVQSDWNVTNASSDAYIKNKPTIPTVNNATLTIQKNGTAIQTFTANSSSDKIANITVPTKTSDLTNDSGYTTNIGTITEIKMNGTSKGTSGVVDLGTVITEHQSLSGYAKTVKIGTTTYSVDTDSTNITLPQYESGAEVNVQSDWNITDSTSDAYIKNKPTIPTVNNGTLTIQRNGTTVKTFTANSSSNVTANITVPTTYSDIGAASSSHTHSLSLATSSDTSSISLSANTKYKLTAGGSTYVFTTPPDTNTTYSGSSTVTLTGTTFSLTKTNVTTALGYSPAKGTETTVDTGRLSGTTTGSDSVAVGSETTASGFASYAGGYRGKATNDQAHAEGANCTASGSHSFASGEYSTASHSESFVFGYQLKTGANRQGVFGYYNSGKADTLFEVGNGTSSTRSNAFEVYSDGKIGNGTYSYTMPSSSGTLALTSQIPTVNNATLTIQKNGTTVQTFTANSSTNTVANISVPTKTSDLTNDSGYTTNTGTITGIKMNGVSKGTSGVVDLGTVITEHQSLTGYAKTADLATVATSGSYADLTNKPTIPTVNNATLTIQKNGSSVGTFTANASANKSINITVPTTYSDVGAASSSHTHSSLTNGDGYVSVLSDYGFSISGNDYDGIIYTTSNTANRSYTMPNKSGTVALTSDIPTVNNGTLTIQKNGTTVKTFTANSSSSVTANITVPTKLSDLTDDVVSGNYLPLSGGTVRGNVSLNNGGTNGIYLQPSATDNENRILVSNGSTSSILTYNTLTTSYLSTYQSNNTLTLPSSSGVLALRSDIPTIDAGRVTTAVKVPANGYLDVTVTFNVTFADVPAVVATLTSGSTASAMGRLEVVAYNTSTTSTKLRIYNNDTSDRWPAYQWIAFI